MGGEMKTIERDPLLNLLILLPMDERAKEAASGTWIGGWTLNKKMLAKNIWMKYT